MTCVQDLPQGDRDSESLQVVPKAKEGLRNSTKGAPTIIKDIPLQQPRIREFNIPTPKASEDHMQAPRFRDGKPRSLPSPPNNNSNTVEPGLQQQAYNPGSSTYQAQGISRLPKAWMRVETNSSLKSEDFSSKEEEMGSKLLAPPAASAMDGWICVERPPMTWEDALKVAQKARETMVGASVTPSPLTSLFDAMPATSQSSEKINTSSQILPGQGAGSSPLPLPLSLPPKQSPSRTSRGCVKARINAFETSVRQGPDLSMSKLENEKVQRETTPAGTAIAARDKRVVEGERWNKWEDKGRIKEPPSSRDSANREKSREENQDPVKRSSTENSPRDCFAKDHQKPRLPDGCQSSRFDKPKAAGRLDPKVAGNLSKLGESADKCRAWRLPELQDINVEALESQLVQNSLTEEEFVSGLKPEGRFSPMRKEESGNFLDQMNCRLISHIEESAAAMEELEGKKREEKAVASESPLPVDDKTVKTTKDVASQDSKGASETHTEDHYCNRVRHPRNSVITIPKRATSDLQRPSRSDDSSWKNFQDLNPSRKSILNSAKSILISAGLSEKFEQTRAYGDQVSSKSLDDAFAAAARQVEIIFKGKPCTVLEHQQSPPVRPAPCGDKFNRSEAEFPSANDSKSSSHFFLLFSKKTPSRQDKKKSSSHLGSGVKQVLSGAVILAGLFALWPRNVDPVARYHVVKAGETLSSIAPGHCTDPSSNFCRINPHVCDQKTIYPGQRIRLS